jgi:hypothetical protein
MRFASTRRRVPQRDRGTGAGRPAGIPTARDTRDALVTVHAGRAFSSLWPPQFNGVGASVDPWSGVVERGGDVGRFGPGGMGPPRAACSARHRAVCRRRPHSRDSKLASPRRPLICRHPVRVSEGTRTPDRRDHNPELYQLSYAHHARCSVNLATPRPLRLPPHGRRGRPRPGLAAAPRPPVVPYAFFVFLAFLAFAFLADFTFRRTFSVFPAFSFRVDDWAITLSS